MGPCCSKNASNAGEGHQNSINAKQQKYQQKNSIDQVNKLVNGEIPKQYLFAEKDKEKENQNQTDLEEEQYNERNQKQRGEKKKFDKIKAGPVQDNQVYENFKQIEKKKTRDDTSFIISCLKRHFVFYNLGNNQLENIVQKMSYCEIDANEFLFKQGDQGSAYFILDYGKLEVIIGGRVVKNLTQGEPFGELALLYNAPRSASIKAVQKCGLWYIDRTTFRKNVEEMVAKEYTENRNFLQHIQFFKNMTEDQKDAIANALITQKFEKGQNIVNEGDQASSFYIIKSGIVSILKEMPDKTQKEIRKMTTKDSFGEQALYQNSTRGCTVKAENEVICLALGRETLTEILGEEIQTIIYRNIKRWAFDKSEVLKLLTDIQKEKIVDAMKIINVQVNEVIFNAGELCNKIVIVIQGNLIKQNNNHVVVQQSYSYGDEFVKNDLQNESIPETLEMDAQGVLGQISFDQFFQIIGSRDFNEVLKKNEFSHEKAMKKNVAKRDTSNWSLNDLIHIKKLGFGQFGNVFLTKSKLTQEYYALKCISKAQVIEQSLEKHLIQEKKVMEMIEFPFIMSFQRSFKDNFNIYFLIEYIRGMELFDVIREIGLLNTFDSQFYIGALLLCLEFLHVRNIIYRDLKPENVMIDENGYLKLIDMGTAKMLSQKQGGARTYTIIGTPHYMAPEIITGKGYSMMVDLWSLGICLYEFMCGGVPFAEEAEDPYEIYEEIIKKSLTFPLFLKDKKAKKFMNQLLHKVPELRFGGSYAALKANAWFNNFDWDKLYQKQMEQVPFKPPQDKMISKNDMKKLEQFNKPILEELKASQDKKYRKENARDPNWDKDF